MIYSQLLFHLYFDQWNDLFLVFVRIEVNRQFGTESGIIEKIKNEIKEKVIFYLNFHDL